jgi:hypothetical protein
MGISSNSRLFGVDGNAPTIDQQVVGFIRIFVAFLPGRGHPRADPDNANAGPRAQP